MKAAHWSGSIRSTGYIARAVGGDSTADIRHKEAK
jgi:hypothetical protein